MEGYEDCKDSGVGCGTVEFTLINKKTDAGNSHNSVNYSLLKGEALGNHDLYARFTNVERGRVANR